MGCEINCRVVEEEPIKSSLDNFIVGGGSCKDCEVVVRSATEPTSERTLIWIDTSEQPIVDNRFITKDGKIFLTKNNENFIVRS